jgi:hypothetical protein
LISKKDKQSAPFFGVCQMGFALGLHALKPGFAWFQTQDKPAKNRVCFLSSFSCAPLSRRIRPALFVCGDVKTLRLQHGRIAGKPQCHHERNTHSFQLYEGSRICLMQKRGNVAQTL